ncbi:hypothetical protein [Actinoplanes sp. N902-109]|uniref:hypothetical protein n=1 Tax=Actinoplanes sp. (strain N902-109) TaxID=649831 RepID=UPI0003296577|nr:hypothetical protein [Actinoplanes sp. N902-109]AGL21092.1 hypothetical protein L083_7582 [Actinoplanes sp. N902-109]
MLTTMATAVLASTALLAPVTAAEAGAPCVRENLSFPAGSWQRIDMTAAEPSGRFQLALGTDTSFGSHTIRWDNGVPTDLGTPPGSFTDINQQGDIIGSIETDSERYYYTAYRYSGGRVTRLPGLPDTVSSSARAIAPDGTIAGSAISAAGKHTAVVWAPDNTIHALPGSGTTSDTDDIDTDGTVIGEIDDHPVRWSPGATAPDPLPAYNAGPNAGWDLTAIGGGVIAGTENPGTGNDSDTRMLVWAPGAAPVPYGAATPLAVSATGDIAYRRPYENELWLRHDGVDHALPFGPSPYPVATVVGINPTHTVYGNNFSTPVRWRCS